jgi:hypothetical protein
VIAFHHPAGRQARDRLGDKAHTRAARGRARVSSDDRIRLNESVGSRSTHKPTIPIGECWIHAIAQVGHVGARSPRRHGSAYANDAATEVTSRACLSSVGRARSAPSPFLLLDLDAKMPPHRAGDSRRRLPDDPDAGLLPIVVLTSARGQAKRVEQPRGVAPRRAARFFSLVGVRCELRGRGDRARRRDGGVATDCCRPGEQAVTRGSIPRSSKIRTGVAAPFTSKVPQLNVAGASAAVFSLR